jgi:hypothetical protein
VVLLETVKGRRGGGGGGDFNDRTGDRLTVGMWLPILLLLCWGERRAFACSERNDFFLGFLKGECHELWIKFFGMNE